jgi:hypothetical protein
VGCDGRDQFDGLVEDDTAQTLGTPQDVPMGFILCGNAGWISGQTINRRK